RGAPGAARPDRPRLRLAPPSRGPHVDRVRGGPGAVRPGDLPGVAGPGAPGQLRRQAGGGARRRPSGRAGAGAAGAGRGRGAAALAGESGPAPQPPFGPGPQGPRGVRGRLPRGAGRPPVPVAGVRPRSRGRHRLTGAAAPGAAAPPPPAPGSALAQRGQGGVQVGRAGAVVGQPGQHGGHAAGVGDRREDQSGGDPGGQEPEGGVHQQVQDQAQQDQGARGEADLAFHGPLGAGGAGGRPVQRVPLLGPGGGAAGEGGGGDAVPGEPGGGVRGAPAGRADDQEATAAGRVPQLGQGAPELVQGDVQRAGQVAGGVLAGRADIDDGELVQPGAGLVGAEGDGGHGGGHGRAGPNWSTASRSGTYHTPRGMYGGVVVELE